MTTAQTLFPQNEEGRTRTPSPQGGGTDSAASHCHDCAMSPATTSCSPQPQGSPATDETEKNINHHQKQQQPQPQLLDPPPNNNQHQHPPMRHPPSGEPHANANANANANSSWTSLSAAPAPETVTSEQKVANVPIVAHSLQTNSSSSSSLNAAPAIGPTPSTTNSTTGKKTAVAARKKYTKGGASSTSNAPPNTTTPLSQPHSDSPKGDTVTARRQKRLERNRESARLSRRRRKQYLEVLEERVTHLSIEMDQGRRAHARQAVTTIQSQRSLILSQNQHLPLDVILTTLDQSLNRMSRQLLVLNTFLMQQLKSFALPPHTKFVLWLTLQGDSYFRGGRAASERLSAARIGERMLNSGSDKVPPAHSMWPLFCNEIGLSYDQEERVRNYQRNLLQNHDSWLERHTANASAHVMQSSHDCVQSVGNRIGQREKKLLHCLTPGQRLKFLSFANRNSDRIKTSVKAHNQEVASNRTSDTDTYQLSKNYHVAANLYILNNRFQRAIASLPRPVSLVSPAYLKKLSRRPSFESLGQQKDENRCLSRDSSFASSGSLKGSASSLSADDSEKHQHNQIAPEEAQEAAAPRVHEILGFVKPIMPPPTAPTVAAGAAAPVPAPVASAPSSSYQYTSGTVQQQQQQQHGHAISHTQQQQQQPPSPHLAQHIQHSTSLITNPQIPNTIPPIQAQRSESIYLAPQTSLRTTSPLTQNQHQHIYQHEQQRQYHQTLQPQQQYHQQPLQHAVLHLPQQQQQQQTQPITQGQHSMSLRHQQQPIQLQQPTQVRHVRGSSFLPPHLNVVPEEMFPGSEGAEDFFISLMDDEDWAIGEGIDMDTTA